MNRLHLLWLLTGCAVVDGDKDGIPIDLDPDTAEPAGDCGLGAVLEVVPLDIWGRDLDTIELSADVTSTSSSGLGPGTLWLPITDDDAVVNLTLGALDHIDATAQLRHLGEGDFELTGLSNEARWAVSSRTESVELDLCEVVTIYLGIDHAWFASTGRAPSLNRTEFLVDPEDFWSATHKELQRARKRVTWNTWWWESDFELTRPLDDHIDMPEHERWANTAMGILSALDGVDRRILVNRFWDDNLDFSVNITADSDLLERVESPSDAFELILQGNPTEVPVTGTYDQEAASFDFAQRVLSNPRYQDREITGEVDIDTIDLELQVASWHQKAVIIDGEVALIGGMNTKNVDWDTQSHFIFDPRRMPYTATSEERMAVYNREVYADNVPRRDYGILVEGPAAWDAEDVFIERWQYGIENGDAYSEYATELAPLSRPDEILGGAPAQTTATMPAPWHEMSIWETHIKSIAQAEDYIFIEDQYFRAPLMIDAIIARMNAVPDLLLTVVTSDVSGYDGGKKYTYLADSKLRDLFPERYQLFVLKTVDMTTEDGWFSDTVTFHQQDILTHSKLRLVDDRYLSVGSCNFNNRGYKYEGELNLSVLDEQTATSARQQVYQNLVGPHWWAYLSDDHENNFMVLQAAADSNQELAEYWEDNAPLMTLEEAAEWWPDYRPSGFLYPLSMENDWEWDVGPDLF
jgi:phosphatidylserine/phosphatidylglycerophosphate/cardiolipin synthase-like enzyme